MLYSHVLRYGPYWVLAPFLVAVAMVTSPTAAEDLLAGGDFAAIEGDGLPEAWSVWTPTWSEAACTVRRVEGGLRMEAPGRPFSVGGVFHEVDGIQGGVAYAVSADLTAERLPWPHQTLTVRITWLRERRPLHPAGMLVRGPRPVEAAMPVGDAGSEASADGAARFEFRDVLVAPAEADSARVALEVKWPREGTVTWHRVAMEPTEPPSPRPARIGTVYLRPRESTPERNLELYASLVKEAGQHNLDIVCLPEALTLVGTGRTSAEVAEPIPGPSTARLGEAAREANVYVVAGLYERDGERLYNTAVLLDREGQLAGSYRKTHIPREEWMQGFTPADDYPVFETDFGTVGIKICYDWFFPEVSAILALRGAEIVLAPTWGTTFPDEEGRVQGETVFRVRARDNGIYLVPCVFDGSSMVIDPLGRILVSNEGKDGLFWCEVDLAEREPLRWVGHWRSIGPRDRMPATYGPLQEP